MPSWGRGLRLPLIAQGAYRPDRDQEVLPFIALLALLEMLNMFKQACVPGGSP